MEYPSYRNKKGTAQFLVRKQDFYTCGPNGFQMTASEHSGLGYKVYEEIKEMYWGPCEVRADIKSPSMKSKNSKGHSRH